MPNMFDACTGVTIGQVSYNCLAHSRPPVIPANKFIGGSPTRVSGYRVVMIGVNYLPMQVLIFRDIQEAINL